MKLSKLTRWDMLLNSAADLIKDTFPQGDPDSPIPVKYQFIRQYFLTEKGVFAFCSDENDELDIKEIYSIPFVVTMDGEGRIHFHYFIDKKVVEVESSLERFIEDTFHSLTPEQRLEIKRYASNCIMAGLEKP